MLTITLFLENDTSMKINYRNIHKVAIEMYKVQHKLCPKFISDIFSTQNGPCTRSGRDFSRPNIESVFKGELSFRSFGPIVWDTMLPKEYKESESLEIFKTKIKNWIPENCHCRQCKDYIPGVGFIDIM